MGQLFISRKKIELVSLFSYIEIKIKRCGVQLIDKNKQNFSDPPQISFITGNYQQDRFIKYFCRWNEIEK